MTSYTGLVYCLRKANGGTDADTTSDKFYTIAHKPIHISNELTRRHYSNQLDTAS